MSNIEWTDKTWNPTRGCSRVSRGCDNCYAISQAVRHDWCKTGQSGTPRFGLYHGLTTLRKDKYDWTGVVRFAEDMLSVPLQRKKPTLYFVGSMSDVFHDSFTNLQIAMIFAVMAACPQHRFQLLTKRPERALRWFTQTEFTDNESVRLTFKRALSSLTGVLGKRLHADVWERLPEELRWPLPNVALGVSAEDQQRADERIPHLLATPAAVRFVSAEPLLGPLELEKWLRWHLIEDSSRAWPPNVTFSNRLDWVIVGGESGPRARPCDVGWLRDIVRQCHEANVACFVKQLGAHVIDRNDAGFDGDDISEWPEETALEDFWKDPNRRYQGAPCRVLLADKKGGDPAEWPDDLRVRQWPGESAA